jgi:hypothetical protein
MSKYVSSSSQGVLVGGDLAQDLALAGAPGSTKRLEQAASLALRLPLPERAWVLRELALKFRPLAPALSFHLLDASEAACRSLPRGSLRDGAFRGLALAFSEMGDLKGTLRCLGAIEAAHVRAMVGSECAARIAGLWEKEALRLLERAQEDVAKVRNPILRLAVAARVAQIWARWDSEGAASLFSLAAETAEGIPEEKGRNAAMAEVVQRSVRYRGDWARSLALRISDPSWRAYAWTNLLQSLPSHVPSSQARAWIRKALHEIRGVGAPEDREVLAFRLAVAALPREPLVALELARKVEDPGLRDEALLLWIQRWKGVKRALCTELVEEIQSPSLRSEALREILTFWADRDLDEILESLHLMESRLGTIRDFLGRFRATLELAKTWREFSPSRGEAFLEKALKEALQISRPESRAMALIEISRIREAGGLGPLQGRASRILLLSSVARDEARQCVELAFSHPEGALLMALRLPEGYPFLRARTLLTLAEVFLQSGGGPWREAVKAAREVLLNLPPSLARERTWAKMARVLARGDKVEGVLFARSLEDGSIREGTLEEIARIRFQESPEGAFRIAASLRDLQRKGRLLRTLIAPWCAKPFKAQYRVDLLDDPEARYWAQLALVLNLTVRRDKGWRRPFSRLRTMIARRKAEERAEPLALLIEALAPIQGLLARRLLREIPATSPGEKAYALMHLAREGMRSDPDQAEVDLRAALEAGLRMETGWIRVRRLRRIGSLLARLGGDLEGARKAYRTALRDALEEGRRERLYGLVSEWAQVDPWGAWRGVRESVDPLRFPSVVFEAARRIRRADQRLFRRALRWARSVRSEELTAKLIEAWAPASEEDAWAEVRRVRQKSRRLEILGSWASSLLRRSPGEGARLLSRLRSELERMESRMVKARVCRSVAEALLPIDKKKAIQWGIMGWEALVGTE